MKILNWATAREAEQKNIKRVLLNLIEDMKQKGYEDKTIIESIIVNLNFNKFSDEKDDSKK